MNRGIRKSTRVKAAELAAQCMQGQCADGTVGSRLAALVVFFESYIEEGITITDQQMKLLGKCRIKELVLIRLTHTGTRG